MARRTTTPFITEEEYLAAEAKTTTRHEYVDGYVFAMTGNTKAHATISGNIFSIMHGHLLGSPCQVYMTEMKLHIKTQKSYYYPDIMVTCEPFDGKSLSVTEPVILVEILSPSTAQIDRREKLIAYQKISSLKEYIIVYQTQQRIDVHCKVSANKWETTVLTNNDELDLASMPNGSLSIPMSQVYARCNPPGVVKESEDYYETDSLFFAGATD